MARGPRCFRCLIFMLSGPVEMLFLVSFMACVIWWLEMRMGSQCSFFVCLLTLLFVPLVACFTVFMNSCLLKAELCFLRGCSGRFVVESVQCAPVSVSVLLVVPVLFKFGFP